MLADPLIFFLFLFPPALDRLPITLAPMQKWLLFATLCHDFLWSQFVFITFQYIMGICSASLGWPKTGTSFLILSMMCLFSHTAHLSVHPFVGLSVGNAYVKLGNRGRRWAMTTRRAELSQYLVSVLWKDKDYATLKYFAQPLSQILDMLLTDWGSPSRRYLLEKDRFDWTANAAAVAELARRCQVFAHFL